MRRLRIKSSLQPKSKSKPDTVRGGAKVSKNKIARVKTKPKTKPKPVKPKLKPRARPKQRALSKSEIKAIGRSIRIGGAPSIGFGAITARASFNPITQNRNITPANIREIKSLVDERIDLRKVELKKQGQRKAEEQIKDNIQDKVNDILRDSAQGSRQEKASLSKQITNRILRSGSKTVSKSTVAAAIPAKLKKRPKKQKGKTQGYNVLVKTRARKVTRKGKTKRIPSKKLQVTKRSLPKGRANRLLNRALDNTIAQTGRIKKSRTLVKKPKVPVKVSNRKFRASKTIKGAKTERRKHAIDTRGEKRKLTVSAWQARRQRKKKPLNKSKRKKKKNGKK